MSTTKLTTAVRQRQFAEAALCHVAQHGMKGLSVAALAKRVGVVPSAMYRHFKGKNDILDALLNAIHTRLLENVAAVRREATEPLDQLRSLLERHIRLICDNEALPRIVFSEDVYCGHPQRKAKLHAVIKDYLGLVGDLVRAGQQQGTIRRDADVPTVAVMFLGLVQTPAVLWHVSGGKFDAKGQSDRAWRLFVRAIQDR